MHGISLPGYVIGLVGYYTYSVPFEAGALSTSGPFRRLRPICTFQIAQLTLMSDCKLKTMRNSCISNNCAPIVVNAAHS